MKARPFGRLGAALCLALVGAWAAASTGARAAGASSSAAPRVVVRPEVPVTPVSLEQARSNNSPALAVDPTEPRFLALASRVDLPAFDCSLHVSGDGGRGWTPARPVPRLPEGAERCYAPEVAFDGDGTLYYLFLGLRGVANTPMGVYLTTSDDHGRSFSSPRRLLEADNFAVRMAIDTTAGERGRIHLVWLDVGGTPALGGFPATPNPIMAAHSDDGGETFSSPVQVSDPDRERVVAPALALGPRGAVHVAYYDLGRDAVDYQGLEGPAWPDPWSLVVTTSTDGGASFGPGVVADDGVVPPGRVLLIFTMTPPALAAGPSGLYLGWHDERQGDWDVWVRRSTDGGRSWAEPVRVNDDTPGNGRHQYMPRLAVAPSGRVDAVFYDRRADADNLRNHLSYTFSADAGASFAPAEVVTPHPSNSTIGPTYPIPSAQGLIDFGSRLGLVSGAERVYLAWTDTANSQPGEQQDVFATEVDLDGARPLGPPEPGTPVGAVVGIGAGVAAVAAAVAGAVAIRRRSRRKEPAPATAPAGGPSDAGDAGAW